MPARGLGTKYQGMNWVRQSTRWAIYVRDMDSERNKLVCSWCLREVFPWSGGKGKKRRRICLDHLVPVALGGSNRPDNLVTSCWSCNNQRRGQDWRDWLDSSNCDEKISTRILARVERALTREERAIGRKLAATRTRGSRSWKSHLTHWTHTQGHDHGQEDPGDCNDFDPRFHPEDPGRQDQEVLW